MAHETTRCVVCTGRQHPNSYDLLKDIAPALAFTDSAVATSVQMEPRG